MKSKKLENSVQEVETVFFAAHLEALAALQWRQICNRTWSQNFGQWRCWSYCFYLIQAHLTRPQISTQSCNYFLSSYRLSRFSPIVKLIECRPLIQIQKKSPNSRKNTQSGRGKLVLTDSKIGYYRICQLFSFFGWWGRSWLNLIIN